MRQGLAQVTLLSTHIHSAPQVLVQLAHAVHVDALVGPAVAVVGRTAVAVEERAHRLAAWRDGLDQCLATQDLEGRERLDGLVGQDRAGGADDGPVVGSHRCAQGEHDLGPCRRLVLVALVTVDLVADDDGGASSEGVDHRELLGRGRLDKPRLHGEGVIADEVDVGRGQVGEVSLAPVEVVEPQSREGRLQVGLVARLAHRRGDHDGVATVGDCIGNQGQQDLRLAHAHVVTDERAAPAGDAVTGVEVGSGLVGQEGPQHALGVGDGGEGLGRGEHVVGAQAGDDGQRGGGNDHTGEGLGGSLRDVGLEQGHAVLLSNT